MEFLDRLHFEMDKKGIKASKLLTDLGLSRNSLVDWKKRGTVPGGETLAKLSSYFGVSVDYLLTGEEEQNRKTHAAEKLYRAFVKAGLIKEGQDLSDRQLAAVIEFFENNADLIRDRLKQSKD